MHGLNHVAQQSDCENLTLDISYNQGLTHYQGYYSNPCVRHEAAISVFTATGTDGQVRRQNIQGFVTVDVNSRVVA